MRDLVDEWILRTTRETDRFRSLPEFEPPVPKARPMAEPSWPCGDVRRWSDPYGWSYAVCDDCRWDFSDRDAAKVDARVAAHVGNEQ